jgi:hypothetical protein
LDFGMADFRDAPSLCEARCVEAAGNHIARHRLETASSASAKLRDKRP